MNLGTKARVGWSVWVDTSAVSVFDVAAVTPPAGGLGTCPAMLTPALPLHFFDDGLCAVEMKLSMFSGCSL